MATKYDQSSATRPVSIRSHTSAFQVHFKHTSSALEMSSVNPPTASVFDSLDCKRELFACSTVAFPEDFLCDSVRRYLACANGTRANFYVPCRISAKFLSQNLAAT